MTIGFTGLLALVFIVLKLCGVITWSWLWVLSPIWIGISVGIVFVLFSAGVLWFLNKKENE